MSFILISSLMIFFSWFIQGIAGFGSAIFMVSLLSFIMNIKSAVLTFTFIQALGPLSILIFVKSPKLNFKLMTYLVAGSFLGIGLGTHVLKTINIALMEFVCGVFFLSIGVFDILSILKKDILNIASKIEIHHGFFVGIFSGFFSALAGIGGPPVAIYLRNIAKEFDEYRFLISLYFVLIVGIRLLVYFVFGAINSVRYDLIAFWGISSLLGLWTGRFLSKFINKTYLNLSVPVLVIFCGILLIFKSMFN